MNTTHKLSLCFILAVIFKGILFVIFIPLGQGPDESNHVIHTLLYAETNEGGKPTSQYNIKQRPSALSRELFDTDPVNDPHFWNYAIRDVTIVEKVFLVLNKNNFWQYVDAPPPFPATLGDVQKQGLGEYITIRRYVTPLYFYFMATLLRCIGIEDITNQWLFLRFVSLVMGTGVIWFSYLTAKIVFTRHENTIVPFAVAAFVAFLPQFSFLSSMVSPDNLLFLCAAAALYLVCRSTRSENKLKYYLGIMLLSALCCSIKEQGIPVAIFAFFAMSWTALHSKNTSPSEKIYALFQPVYVFMAFLLLVGAIVWLAGDQESLGRFFNVTHARSNNVFRTFLTPADYVRCFFIWFVSFWFSYGWMVYKMSIAWYCIFGIITFIALIGVAKATRKGTVGETDIFLIISFVFISLFSVLVFYGPGHKGMQARHFFAALPAIAILMVTGIHSVMPQKFQNVATGVFILFLVFLNAVTVIKYVIPIYYL